MRFRLHREGYLIVPLTIVLAAALAGFLQYVLRNSEYLWLAHLAAALLLVFLLLVLNFFRNPRFPIRSDEAQVLAPANGKLVVIEEVDEPAYFGDRRLQLSIFMSPLDVHVNRAPVRGRLRWLEYFPGKYLVAWHPKSSSANEQTFLVLENAQGEVGLKQIAGAVARRIRWYVAVGQDIAQGAEIGFIRFGSRVDVLLPPDVIVKAELGQAVKAGRTVLAEYPSSSPMEHPPDHRP